MRREVLAALAVLVAGVVVAGASALHQSSTAGGTVVFRWSYGKVESGTLSYSVSGPMLGAGARESYAPSGYPAAYRHFKGDGRADSLKATLSSFSYRLVVRTPCADGSTSVVTTGGSTSSDRRAVLSLGDRLEVNLPRLRGTTTVVPDSRDLHGGGGAVQNSTVWRGLGAVTLATTGDACPGDPAVPTSQALRVDELVPRSALIAWSPERNIPVSVRSDGSLRAHGGWTDGFNGYSTHIAVDLRLRGPLAGFHAFCDWPTNHDLAGARTVARAEAVVTHAGLVTRFGGDKANAAVLKGRFFIDSASPGWPCGVPSGAALFRSG